MKFSFEWRGDMYDCEWIEDFDKDNFRKFENIIGAHAFVFDDDNKLLLVKVGPNDPWALPGGHPEKGDSSLEQTLIREVDEEADVEVKDVAPIGIMRSCKRGTRDVQHQVRFIARVSKIKEPTVDIATGNIPERKFIDTADFIKEVGWGENGEWQIKRALEVLRENSN